MQGNMAHEREGIGLRAFLKEKEGLGFEPADCSLRRWRFLPVSLPRLRRGRCDGSEGEGIIELPVTEKLLYTLPKGSNMLTTVTTTTTTTVVALGQAAVFGAVSTVVLIALLILKELASASEGQKANTLGKIASAAINPLLFVFMTIVAVKVLEVL